MTRTDHPLADIFGGQKTTNKTSLFSDRTLTLQTKSNFFSSYAINKSTTTFYCYFFPPTWRRLLSVALHVRSLLSFYLRCPYWRWVSTDRHTKTFCSYCEKDCLSLKMFRWNISRNTIHQRQRNKYNAKKFINWVQG